MEKEPITHADKLYMDFTRRYPGLVACEYALSNYLFLGIGTGYEWVNGQIVCTINTPIPNDYQMSAETAYYKLIASTFFTFSDSAEWSPLWNIPSDVTEDWLDKISSFCYFVSKTKVKHYKLHVKSHLIFNYGEGFYKHPDGLIKWEYVRSVDNFIKLRKQVKELCKKYGWAYFAPMTKKRKAAREKFLNAIIDEVKAEESKK